MPLTLDSNFAGIVCAATRALGRLRPGRRSRIEQLNRSVLAHAAHGIISTDTDGRIETFSRGAERLLGYAAFDVVGVLTLDALHDPRELEARAKELSAQLGRVVRPDFSALVACIRGDAQPDEREWHYGRRGGGRVLVRVSITAVHDRRGRVAGYLAIASDLTEHRLAEERRREFDARLGKIATQVPGMVFQFTQRADGRRCFPYASEGIREIFQVTPEAVAHDSSLIWERIHPEDVDRLAASIDHSAKTLERWQCEFRTRFADGEVRWLWGTALPERADDGAVTWHGFISDITERKRAEQAHEESRALLQSVFSSVDLGVFVVDVTGGGDFRFVEVNPAYERLTGISAAEVRGRTPREIVPLIPAEMAECLRASFRRGAEAPGPIEYEEPFFIRGRLLWWLTRLTPLRDSVGNVVRLVGRSLDITERKTIELRFQSLTERLQLATEAAQLGIWDLDLTQSRLVWDKRMFALYGIESMRFDGAFRSWIERIHEGDIARVERELREAKEGRKPFNTSFRIRHPEGEREIRACAHVQRNPAGRAVRMVGVNWDVTTEKRAQAEVIHARDQAENLNRQLEAALSHTQRLAEEAAAATVAKSEFLANMSHEIRTPLNAVLGMSGLLLGTPLTQEQREFCETIRSSGDALLGLINDILDYSKIESGMLDLERRPFDLRECVESAIDVLASRAAEKKIDLLCAIQAGAPEAVVGDITRLRQVIVNLLSNAVKFTERGEVFLSVRAVHEPRGEQGTGSREQETEPRGAACSLLPAPCSRASEASVRLVFAVHDSGIGIPADRMHRLFKTFSQVDASTTRQYGGTGLGLAITKRIVEMMGGQIRVESTAGKGSVFSFEIDAPAAAAEPKPFASGRSPALAGRRLLIVDDNATSCRTLCQQAVAWGLTPRAVASGADALGVLAREQFDLVLADLEMPEMSGAELAAQIRRDHATTRLPIAMLMSPGCPRPAAELAIAGVVSKPVKAAALYDSLVAILHGRVAAPTPAATADALLGEKHPLSILLAEDNPVNQRVATLMLQRLGYRADVVGNGREALEAVARQNYDLILMDVQMPEMDGIQATREICTRWPAASRPRIVAMTANASTTDREQCLAAGMSEFLSKPVRATELRRALEETTGRYVESAA